MSSWKFSQSKPPLWSFRRTKLGISLQPTNTSGTSWQHRTVRPDIINLIKSHPNPSVSEWVSPHLLCSGHSNSQTDETSECVFFFYLFLWSETWSHAFIFPPQYLFGMSISHWVYSHFHTWFMSQWSLKWHLWAFILTCFCVQSHIHDIIYLKWL